MTARPIRTGESSRISSSEPTKSNARLTRKSKPSNTGGRSSKSGSVAPGDELRAAGQDAHGGRRDADVDAAPVALVDELDGQLLREVRVGDDDLLDAVLVEHLRQVGDLPERHAGRCPAAASAR